MTETWLQWCIRQDGPPEKRGYGGVTTRSLAEIEGEVKHSTEGPLAAALGELFKPTREASWHFTVPKEGPPRQHYSLESICWHCGGPGDRRTDTSLIGNLTLIGIEHEDYPDNQLSANQIQNTTRLSQEIRARCSTVAANPPTLRRNLWEHNWLSQTACPSGLIPWGAIIPQLQAAPIPYAPQEEDIDMFIAKAVETGNYYVIGPTGKHLIDDVTELMVYQRKLGKTAEEYAQAQLNFLPDT